jgi:hypothetical protein
MQSGDIDHDETADNEKHIDGGASGAKRRYRGIRKWCGVPLNLQRDMVEKHRARCKGTQDLDGFQAAWRGIADLCI